MANGFQFVDVGVILLDTWESLEDSPDTPTFLHRTSVTELANKMKHQYMDKTLDFIFFTYVSQWFLACSLWRHLFHICVVEFLASPKNTEYVFLWIMRELHSIKWILMNIKHEYCTIFDVNIFLNIAQYLMWIFSWIMHNT